MKIKCRYCGGTGRRSEMDSASNKGEVWNRKCGHCKGEGEREVIDYSDTFFQKSLAKSKT